MQSAWPPSVPTAARGGPRWLWTLGWLSAALFIALAAMEEFHRQVDLGSLVAAALGVYQLSEELRWVLVAAPLAAPLAAAAGWVLLTSQRDHPARALLTLLAVALALGTLIQDAIGNLLVYPLLVSWLGFPEGEPGLRLKVEEGSELMAAAALGVILIEMLAARPGAVRDTPGRGRRGPGRRAAALAATAVLLAASAFPLLSTQHVFEDNRWGRASPWSYTGPVSLVEQRFRATHDNLQRIDVWSYVDGAPGEAAQIFARLTPVAGSDGPIRESRAAVYGAVFSNSTVAFHFAPIPDSGGTLYTLAVGVLSGPTPYVFLGLTGGDVIPEGAAVVSGAPTRYADDLVLRTSYSGRFIEGLLPRDPRHSLLIGEGVMNILLWVFLVVAAWAGLSGRRPRFWRTFVWPSALTSALVTADILIITLAFLSVLSPARLA